MTFDVNHPATWQELAKVVTSADVPALDFAIESAKQACEDASEARQTLEEKANNLIGYAGILTGLLAAGISLEVPTLPDGSLSTSARLGICGLAIGTILVGACVFFALACVRVGKRQWVVQHAYNGVDLLAKPADAARRELLTDLMFAAGKNHNANLVRADHVRRSQSAMAAAVVVILAAALMQVYALLGGA